MKAQQSGIVGRMVSMEVTRGEGVAKVVADEVCEVVACMAAGEYGSWRILVATHDGCILDATVQKIRLVGETSEGPYR